MSKILEAQNALCKDNLISLIKTKKQEISVIWGPPPYEWTALNTDGAAKVIRVLLVEVECFDTIMVISLRRIRLILDIVRLFMLNLWPFIEGC